MYWLVLILALETEQGIATSEHYIQVVSSRSAECEEYMKGLSVTTWHKPFIAARFMCKWKSAVNGSVE